MCGIAGIVDFKGKYIDKSTVKLMCDALAHRGPDGEGFFENEVSLEKGRKASVCLGHRRLSIIDLKTGQQPIFNEDGTVAIVHNGEIYNFRELRAGLEEKGHIFKTQSDTETIVHLYEEKGEDFAQYLRGMFSIALWDGRKDKLILARDCFGKKPLLYAYRDNKVVFASEFRAIMKEPGVSREIDYSALDDYFTYLCIPAPKTIYSQIRKVKPAHMVIFEKDKVREYCYWQIDFRKKIRISEKEAKEELLRLLKEAVKIRLVSDVPLGAFLSGGVDSSTVVALMHMVSSEKVKTFSIGFKEALYNELPYARIIANRFGTDHQEFIVQPRVEELLPLLVRHFGEPYADSSAIPTYYLSQMTARHVKVALNGDGGDEAFVGYKHHLASLLAGRLHRLPRLVRDKVLFSLVKRFTAGAGYSSAKGHLYRFAEAARLSPGERYKRWMCFYGDEMKDALYLEGLKHEIKESASVDLIPELFAANADLDVVDASLLSDISLYLPSDLLVKMDITSMANSLETRSPFLDRYVMEFMASLPVSLKMKNASLKYLLKSTVKDIVPRKNLYRVKKGFAVPIGPWLKNELNLLLKNELLSENAAIAKIFNMNYVKTLINDHCAGRKDCSHYLWILLMFELWCDEFRVRFDK